MPKRVLVIVNKFWEFDPVASVLLNENIRPSQLYDIWPSLIHQPRNRRATPLLPFEPRLSYSFPNSTIEFWCISDGMEDPKLKNVQSVTSYKVPVFKTILPGQAPDLVIAAGTAAHPSEFANGSVVMGSNVFICDGSPNDASGWKSPDFEKLIPSSLPSSDFGTLTGFRSSDVTSLMVNCPNNGLIPAILSDASFAAISDVNVLSGAYSVADAAAIRTYRELDVPALPVSLETTHGLIRVMTDPVPFMFVSGIANRVGHFGDEVKSQQGGQNSAAAFNLGLVLAFLVPQIAKLYGDVLPIPPDAPLRST